MEFSDVSYIILQFLGRCLGLSVSIFRPGNNKKRLNSMLSPADSVNYWCMYLDLGCGYNSVERYYIYYGVQCRASGSAHNVTIT